VACVTLAACLRWCAARSSRALSRQAQVARSLELAQEGVSDAAAAQALAERVEEFVGSLGLPRRIRDTAVARDSLTMTARAFAARKGSLLDGVAAQAAEVIGLLDSAW
jgi:alcohol dehydrogenase class IV